MRFDFNVARGVAGDPTSGCLRYGSRVLTLGYILKPYGLRFAQAGLKIVEWWVSVASYPPKPA